MDPTLKALLLPAASDASALARCKANTQIYVSEGQPVISIQPGSLLLGRLASVQISGSTPQLIEKSNAEVRRVTCTVSDISDQAGAAVQLQLAGQQYRRSSADVGSALQLMSPVEICRAETWIVQHGSTLAHDVTSHITDVDQLLE
jgi:hypothetical protein